MNNSKKFIPRGRDERPRVLIVVDDSVGNRREVLRGMLDYARHHARWLILPTWSCRAAAKNLAKLFPDYDGCLVHEGSASMYDALAAKGVPVVNAAVGQEAGSVGVGVDQHAVGRMAFGYFRDQGFHTFALVRTDTPSEADRCEGFRRAAAGFDCRVFEWEGPTVGAKSDRPAELRRRWAGWLHALPRPAALFAPRALVAHDICFVAESEGIRVPEEIAVLGVGNNELQCQACDPPLSTIDTGSHQRGFLAARMLDEIFQGKTPEPACLILPPQEVIVRRSTDVLAIEDANLAAALRLIRDRACDGVSIGKMIPDISMSRRSLETGVRRVLGRTLHEEVMRIRLARAKELLRSTDLPLPEITSRCGFTYASHLCRQFKARFGDTPVRYRSQHR